jgi:hypothetical protein
LLLNPQLVPLHRGPRRVYEFALSYIELYNEDLLDLLSDDDGGGGEGAEGGRGAPMLIREDAEKGVHIQVGAVQVEVS